MAGPRFYLVLGLCLIAACGGDDGSPADSAAPDSTVDGGGADTGAVADAGEDSAPASDSSTDSGTAPTDSGPADSSVDAGGDSATSSCRPERVTSIFIASADFAVGVLCDDLFVCAVDAADAEAIVAAAPEFECAEEPGAGGRCTAYTCTYRDPGGPSTVDAAEYQAICAVTLLEPARPMYCAVYG